MVLNWQARRATARSLVVPLFLLQGILMCVSEPSTAKPPTARAGCSASARDRLAPSRHVDIGPRREKTFVFPRLETISECQGASRRPLGPARAVVRCAWRMASGQANLAAPPSASAQARVLDGGRRGLYRVARVGLGISKAFARSGRSRTATAATPGTRRARRPAPAPLGEPSGARLWAWPVPTRRSARFGGKPPRNQKERHATPGRMARAGFPPGPRTVATVPEWAQPSARVLACWICPLCPRPGRRPTRATGP